MASREHILSAIRKRLPESQPAPSLEQAWTTYADPTQQFADVLHGVGGLCVRCRNLGEVRAHLASVPEFSQGTRICSAVPGISLGNVILEKIDDPHDLADVDYAVLPGEFAVAENAAVWVDGSRVSHQAIYFIAQHVALVVPAAEVVHNLHQAYARLSFPDSGYGVFISGPSKTADIEQSLVIGAHGARSQIVYLVDEMSAN